MEAGDERASFIRELFEFLQARGVPNPKVPMIGGKELDLFTLYRTVTSRGGAESVSANKLWKEIVNEFDLPPSCTSASFTLKNHYQKYLLAFERRFFLKKDDFEGVPIHRDGPFLLKRAEPPIAAESRNEPSHSLKESLLRVYGDRLRAGDELYCLARTSLESGSGEARRLALAFECALPGELRYALNSLLLLSCSCQTPFSVEAHRALFRAFEIYFLRLKAWLRSTRYFLPHNEVRAIEHSEKATLPLSELLEQFKVMLTILRNLALIPANEEFFSRDGPLTDALFDVFLAANEGEVARLALELFATLSRHVVLRAKRAGAQRQFMERVVEGLLSEHDCELAIEALHNLTANQENETAIEAFLPRFVGVLTRLLVSGTAEVLERALEIICYLSDFSVGTRTLLARQPHFFARLLALIAGKTLAADKAPRVAAMIISNLMVTAAARAHLKHLEGELFAICAMGGAAADGLAAVLHQLGESGEGDGERRHTTALYEEYIAADLPHLSLRS